MLQTVINKWVLASSFISPVQYIAAVLLLFDRDAAAAAGASRTRVIKVSPPACAGAGRWSA